MENNITNDVLAAMLMDPSSAQRRLSPNWLASALLYRRPEYVTEEPDQWPVPDTAPTSPVGATSTQPTIGTGRARMVMGLANAGKAFVDAIRGQNEFDHPEVVPGIMSGRDLGETVARNVQARGETGLQFLSNLRSARGEQGLLDVLKSYDPDAQTTRDRYGNTIVTFGGQPYYLNRSGLSDRDLQEGVRDMVVTAPFSGAAGRVTQGANFLRRAGGQALAGLFGSATSDANSARVGSRQGFDVPAAAMSAGMMAAFEALSFGRAVSPMMRGARNTPQVRASRTPEIYDSPPHPQRPFADDYPSAARSDAAGNLTHDMDGRPLDARFVFGRRTKDVPDVGMQGDDYDRLAVGLMGKRPTYRRMDPRHGGDSDFDYFGRLTDIVLNRRLNPVDRLRVYAHELAHGIDEFVRQIPVEEFMRELRPLYNTLNNPKRTPDGLRAAPGRMFTPEDRDPIEYAGANGLREYAAEAIRVYLTHPNYIKSVAPKTAAMIRKWVNEHPELSRIIQFNSMLAVPAAGLARPSEQAEDEL